MVEAQQRIATRECVYLAHAKVGTGFGRHGLYEHANCHARGEGVGVDDNVRHYALRSERHVVLRVQNGHSALHDRKWRE
jgi:hypothetical protein